MARGNETTTKFKVDISELKKSMQEARKQVAYANSEFKEASSSMDDWSKSSDGISAKLKQLNSNLNSQEKVLREYEKTLDEVKKEYGENSAEALEYATKLNNQKAVVNRIKKEMAGYEDTLQEVSEAEKIASKTGKDVADVLADMGDKAEESGDGFTVLKGAVAEFVGNALTQLAGALRDGISSLVSFSDEADKAMNNFQASTGSTAEEIAEFEDTMKNIYKGNYGESFEDIADSMATVKNTMGDWLDSEGLEILTKDALVLRDTFDFEVNESIRAVNAMVNQFGIDGDYAFNLIAQGAQNGLNQNGDLLDIINEYSVQFASAGYSADDMFNMLANGAGAGTWSVDKLGDAVKEMNIRFSDGTVVDALAENRKALGLTQNEVKELQSEFNNGGDSAQNAVNKMIDSIMAVEDETERYKLGVSVFGTMWEDLGADAISALMDTNGQIDMTKDSMAELDAVKYNSVGEAIQGIGRNLQTGVLMPIGDKLLPIISDLAAKFREWLDDPATQEGIKQFTDSVAQFVDNGLVAIKNGVQWFLDNKDTVISGLAGIATGFVAFNVASMIMGVVNAFKAFKAANEGATIAQWLLNTAMNANPIMLIVTLVATLVGALVTFIATNEDARAKISEIWQKIKDAIGTAIEGIGKFFTETIPQFFTGLIDWIKANWQNILLFLINPFAGLFKYFYDNNSKFREFVDNAIKYIKELPAKVQTWLTNTINKVSQWTANMISKAKETASNFVTKIIEFVSQLPAKVWSWFTSTVSKVASFGVDLANKGREAGTKLFNGIVDTVKELPSKFLSIGGDIISGLWRGISGAISGLYNNIKSSLSGLVSKAKEALGIHSPSKVFADEIGKWIPEGIAVGIDKNAKSALTAMKELTADTLGSARAGLSGATATLGGTRVSSTGGVVNNFYQTINSPKQLSRLDIYRQSKNLLGYAGGGQ